MQTAQSCFVIMPYGKDKAKYDDYMGIFDQIIKPAALRCGIPEDNIKRSDISAQPGHIASDIIRDLANYDIVIADLTGGNPNVFFELGIRHSFRKSGTIHIKNVTSQLPFDVSGYRVIEYDESIKGIKSAVDGIANAIKKRVSEPFRADNPVHDAIPGLPSNLMSAGDEALRQQVNQLQSELKNLSGDKEKLSRKLMELSPDTSWDSEPTEVDIDTLFQQADETRGKGGEFALLRLQSALEAGGKEDFIATLKEVIKSPLLTSSDLIQMARQCRDLELEPHRIATLRVARGRFPSNESVLLALIDALDDSPADEHQREGMTLIEHLLHMQKTPEGPKLPQGKNVQPSHLGLLFNFYFRRNKPEFVHSVAESADKILPGDPMVLYNKARALHRMGRDEEAEEAFKQAIKLDPRNDTAHVMYGDFLDDLSRYEQAYIEHEEAIRCDFEDGTRFFNLGAQILSRGYVRDKHGDISGPLGSAERLRYALPFLIRASKEEKRPLRQAIIRVLFVNGYKVEAGKFAAQREPYFEKAEGAAYNYVLGRQVGAAMAEAPSE